MLLCCVVCEHKNVCTRSNTKHSHSLSPSHTFKVNTYTRQKKERNWNTFTDFRTWTYQQPWWSWWSWRSTTNLTTTRRAAERKIIDRKMHYYIYDSAHFKQYCTKWCNEIKMYTRMNCIVIGYNIVMLSCSFYSSQSVVLFDRKKTVGFGRVCGWCYVCAFGWFTLSTAASL